MKMNNLFNINNELINDSVKLIKSFSTKKKLLMNNMSFDIIIN